MVLEKLSRDDAARSDQAARIVHRDVQDNYLPIRKQSRSAPKTHSQESSTTVNEFAQENKQCKHTESELSDHTTPGSGDRNPFLFSRGHWLSHDSARQTARQIHFNFPELCKGVVACSAGAKSVASWSKQDGHISRTLTFHTDNGKRIVVRLPTPAAGPAGRNVNSEVATVKYGPIEQDLYEKLRCIPNGGPC
ncbi:hypothetical protein KCU65_g382, partial [Aureobasidium melanogenum]